MFSKTADPTSAPNPAATARGGSNSRSILSADLKITGEITSTGIVEVLGEVDGTIAARGLIVGSEGRVTGTISAETVEVKGRLDGRVSTEGFTLRAAAQVEADIACSNLVIESGAQIEGHFSMSPRV
jgi:cytoskeletal protein CcmA (bactofilin family)